MSNYLEMGGTTPEYARIWLARNHYVDAVAEAKIEEFFTDPPAVPHVFLAMICIANAATTPQDWMGVYDAVTQWEKLLIRNQQ